MKRLIIILIFCSFYTIFCKAQWQADVRLTNNPGSSATSLNNARCIASIGDSVHVVWYDNRDGNYEIYYKRNPTTKIKYDITNSSFTKLIIYDILGRKVATLVNEKQSPGKYEVEFDGSNYPSRVYFYKIQTESFSETKRMVLIK